MAHYLKIIVGLLIAIICLLGSVKAIGVGPQELSLTVERGKETVVARTIQVLNSDTRSIHIVATVSGPIAKFVTIEPKEFDLPAGPGLHSTEPSPYKTVKVIFDIPREVSQNKYTGEILFTEQPVKGGTIATAAQVRVRLELNIGSIAQAQFPTYLNVLVAILIILMLTSIILWRFKP